MQLWIHNIMPSKWKNKYTEKLKTKSKEKNPKMLELTMFFLGW